MDVGGDSNSQELVETVRASGGAVPYLAGLGVEISEPQDDC